MNPVWVISIFFASQMETGELWRELRSPTFGWHYLPPLWSMSKTALNLRIYFFLLSDLLNDTSREKQAFMVSQPHTSFQFHLGIDGLKIWVGFKWQADRINWAQRTTEIHPQLHTSCCCSYSGDTADKNKWFSIFSVPKYFNYQNVMITVLVLFSAIILGWSSFNMKVVSQKYKRSGKINKIHMEPLVLICAQCCLNLWCWVLSRE